MPKTRAAALFLVMACGCTSPQSSNAPPRAADAPWQPEIVGKVWVSTDKSAAPGSFRIFLPNGTLVGDSCWETYRLAPWRTVGDCRIEWTEDTARIEAQITELTDDRLQLRLQLKGEVKEENYRPASVPAVCPDMPR
jgi:hypothetical protein